MEDKLITVPIVDRFGSHKIIGSLTILESALPAAPGFVFSLAYKTLGPQKFAAGEIPTEPYVGPYQLDSVAPVLDQSYFDYLKQVGY